MNKSTRSSKRQAESQIKRSYNRNKILRSSYDRAVDRISQLPDEILISILCRLPLKEAIATSVLSSHWRHLYTCIDHLKFPPVILRETKEEFLKYLNMIDHTFDLFRANTALKKLSLNIHQCLEGANVDSWFEFALARKVETVYLHLCYNKQSFLYTLQLPNLIGESLKKLFLSGIHVEDPEFDLLLTSFPRLETLSISDSKRLKNVSVVGIHPLKSLGLCHLENLESVQIRDMISLVSFTCFADSEYALQLHNVPKLSEFRVSETGADVLPSIQPSIRDQVRFLWLTGDPTVLSTEQLYNLKNVKHLDLYLGMYPGYSNHQLRKFFLLIAEYTSLETLDVEFKWDRTAKEKTQIEEIDVPLSMKRPCPNLKRVALSGYTGYKEELNFALLILNNSEALQRLIVKLDRDLAPKKRRAATARTWKQFRRVVPSSANLAIM